MSLHIYGNYKGTCFDFRKEGGLPMNSKIFKEKPLFKLNFEDSSIDNKFRELGFEERRKLAFLIKDAMNTLMEENK